MVSPIAAEHLRTEYLVDPLGLDETLPRFSWWVGDDRPGAVQTASRIRCASDPDRLARGAADLWDSGKVERADQSQVAYAGRPLGSRQSVWWDVQLWDGEGAAGEPSAPARFEMGLLCPEDWQAEWIGAPLIGTGVHRPPVPLLRRAFTLADNVQQARLYITALGLYVPSINGQRVGEDWFRPGWTDYRKRVPYQVYDVTAHLKPGANAIGALLGDGWYCGRVASLDRGTAYGTVPSLRAQLEILLADGSRVTIATDAAWRWTTGAILGADLIDGEDHDARRAVDGWDRPGAVSGDWRPVELMQPDHAGPLVASPSLPVRCVEERIPVSDPQPVACGWGRRGYIVDLGQNLTGVIRYRVRGPAGATVRFRYGEMLQSDGCLYTANLRSARATDYYTLRGDPQGETWTPAFTFHGFRYVEVSAPDHWFGNATPLETPTRDSVIGLVLMSETPETGRFTCDHELLNRLQSNIRWGQRGNFLEAPTDCPQRDERLGWTGDAQVFASTAAFNADVAAFFTKWLRDLVDAQSPQGEIPSVAPNVLGPGDGGPGWSDACIVVPWTIYNAYADRRVLERCYPAIKHWLAYLQRTSRDGLRCGPWHEGHRGFGDWLALDIDNRSATSKMLIGTAAYAMCAGRGAEIAALLGAAEDARSFAAMQAEAVAAFNREFVSPAGALSEPTQTAYLMALAWDLLPEPMRPAAFARLLERFAEKNWHLCTGFLGTPLICPVLTRFGRVDLAYRILLQTTYPGWLFPIGNGATTMWERWNSWTPERGFGDVGMNSFNHYAYGAIGNWIYQTIGGIAPAQPGYRQVHIAPRPGGPLTHAEAALDSPHGRIETSWTRDGNKFHLTVRIPANTTATVALPDGATHAVAAGTHKFSALLAAPDLQ